MLGVRKRELCIPMLPLALVMFALANTTAWGESGTQASRTVTFADRADPQFTVSVSGYVLPTITSTVWLQFATEGTGVPLPATAMPGLTFTLKHVPPGSPPGTSPGALALTPGLDRNGLPPFDTKRIQFTQVDAANSLYKLEITHNSEIPIGTTEEWTVEMTNVPTAGPPSVRAMAYVSTTGEFTSLTPTGPATTVAENVYAAVAVDDTSSPGEIIYSATLINPLAGHTYSYSWAPEDDAATVGSYNGAATDTLTYTKPVTVSGNCRLITFRVTVTDDATGDVVTVNRRTTPLIVVQSISVSLSPSGKWPVGQTGQATATGTFCDGSTRTLGVADGLNWTPGDPGIATVNAAGLVTAVGAGFTTINAAVGEVSGSGGVIVYEPQPTDGTDGTDGGPTLVSLSISPNPVIIEVGSTVRPLVTGTNSDGNTVIFKQYIVAWNSRNPSIVSVTPLGLKGESTGQTSVTATVGSVSRTVGAQVIPAR